MERATIKWTGRQEFLARTPSDHTFTFDAGGEHSTGPSPMEILLPALGACTASDVVTILQKKRQPLEGLEVEISGERAADPPRVWTRIEVVYRLRGNLDEKAVRDAIDLSEKKYCSVSAMLQKTARITFRHEISKAQPAEK